MGQMGRADFPPPASPFGEERWQECCLFPRWEEARHESAEGEDGALPPRAREVNTAK